jgi:soluble lytic murein transglycosylase-like protein
MTHHRASLLFLAPQSLRRWLISALVASLTLGSTAGFAAPAVDADALPAAPESLDDLYDLTLLADRDGDYAALLAAFRARKHAQVLKLADVVLQRAAHGPVRQAAQLLIAMSHARGRSYSLAAQAYAPLAQSGPFAQRARLALAEMALLQKDLPVALVQLAAVAAWHPDRDRATLQMAELELGRGQVGPARDALERVRDEALTGDDRARFLYLSGEVARRRSEVAEAAKLLRAAWWSDERPWDKKAAQRLQELAEATGKTDLAPSATDRIERALRRNNSTPYQRKISLAEASAAADGDPVLLAYAKGSLLTDDKPTRAAAIALLHDAVQTFVARTTPAASTAADPAPDQPAVQPAAPDPVLHARLLYARGDALGKAGKDAAAIADLAAIAGLRATATATEAQQAALNEVQARALARLHRVYHNRGEAPQAKEALQRLLSNHPVSEEREVAVWSLGLAEFLAGKPTEALKHFVQLERQWGHLWTGAQQPWRAKAIYWQGRSLQEMGQVDAAVQAFTSVATLWPQTYYGVVALDRIREVSDSEASRLQGPPPQPAGDEVPLTLNRLRVAKTAALDEAALLTRMGLHAEARTLLQKQLPQGLPRDGIQLLAALYQESGQARAAMGVLQKHTRRAARPDDATASMWRQSFPRAHFEPAASAAKQAGIPRSLLYAIMRHESSYVPTVVSGAGAYGLTQVLPGVAKNIADLYKLPRLSNAQLLQAAPNLQVGALYLSQLASLFRGNIALIAAGYNAGPYAVQGWIKRWPTLPTDALVECIPFPATRAYVMQVTASAQTYAFLYPEWNELERDRLGRSPLLPKTLGPFMKAPRDTASSGSLSGTVVVGR